MRFCWLAGRAQQGQLNAHWESGKKNLAAYFAKHHPPSHHAKARPTYLKEQSSPSGLQWCADMAKGHQPAGKKAGVQGQTQGLSQAAKDALARALGMAAAPQA